MSTDKGRRRLLQRPLPACPPYPVFGAFYKKAQRTSVCVAPFVFGLFASLLLRGAGARRGWFGVDVVFTARASRRRGVQFVKLAALIYETDLYPKFWWFVREMKTIANVGRCAKVVQGIYESVWPLYAREVLMLG